MDQVEDKVEDKAEGKEGGQPFSEMLYDVCVRLSVRCRELLALDL